MKSLIFCLNETQLICIFIFKTTWKSYFKNNAKIPGNLLKKPGKIMEFCQSEKVGTLDSIYLPDTHPYRNAFLVIYFVCYFYQIYEMKQLPQKGVEL